jgi:peptide/nickel transport system permease protein
LTAADPKVFDPAAEGERTGKVRSEWLLAWYRFRRNKAAIVGGIILAVIATIAVFADAIAPYDLSEYETGMEGFLAPPGSPGHLLGTDDFGRDVLSRVIHASRISLRIGLVAVFIGSIGGTLIGLTAGFFGGRIDWSISRVLDVMLAFPGVLLAIVIVSSLGPGLTNAMIALGVSAIPYYARVVRGSTLAARELVYVRAARAVGMSELRIMLRHVLPNIISPIIIMVTLGMATSIIAAAGLSFLGLGAVPPTPEWGLELSVARRLLRVAPWIGISHGVAIFVTVMSINLLGDGLREALDPQATSWVK